MRDIGVAIIGYGFMGRMHGYGVRNLHLLYPDLPFTAHVLAVASGTPAHAQKAARELDVPFCTDDYRAAIARPGVDAVCVAVPNHLHEEVALAALRAGKHIYVDKPLSTSFASAQRIHDAWQASGLIGQMVHHARFFPCVMRAKALVEEGRIGRLLTARASYLHSGSVGGGPVGWKQNAAIGGCVLHDLGAHALDMLAHLAGAPDRVCALRQTAYPVRPTKGGGSIHAGDDAAYALLTWPCGACGSMDCSKIATGAMDEFAVEVRGELGALRLDLMDPNWLWFYDQQKPEGRLGGERGFTRIECIGRFDPPAGGFPPPKNAIGWERAHAHCMHCFLSSIYRGGAASPTICEGLLVQKLLDALERSAAAGTFLSV